jgi:hypothetical protein
VKIALWVIGIVALATVAAVAGSGRGGDDVASNLPRPSAAFCRAAAKYDEAISASSEKVSVAHHVEMTHAIATSAPKDTKADAMLVWRSFVKLSRGDRSVVDDPQVKAAIAHVNRRAGQDCGWFQRQGM